MTAYDPEVNVALSESARADVAALRAQSERLDAELPTRNCRNQICTPGRTGQSPPFRRPRRSSHTS